MLTARMFLFPQNNHLFLCCQTNIQISTYEMDKVTANKKEYRHACLPCVCIEKVERYAYTKKVYVILRIK